MDEETQPPTRFSQVLKHAKAIEERTVKKTTMSVLECFLVYFNQVPISNLVVHAWRNACLPWKPCLVGGRCSSIWLWVNTLWIFLGWLPPMPSHHGGEIRLLHFSTALHAREQKIVEGKVFSRGSVFKRPASRITCLCPSCCSPSFRKKRSGSSVESMQKIGTKVVSASMCQLLEDSNSKAALSLDTKKLKASTS